MRSKVHRLMRVAPLKISQKEKIHGNFILRRLTLFLIQKMKVLKTKKQYNKKKNQK